MLKTLMKAVLFASAAAIVNLPAQSVDAVGNEKKSMRKTISEVKTVGIDGQYVIVRGTLTRRFSQNDFFLTDNTGEIRIDLEDDHWPISLPTGTAEVEIVGKIDIDLHKAIEIDVKDIRILPPKNR